MDSRFGIGRAKPRKLIRGFDWHERNKAVSPPLWSAPAERSGDGALNDTEAVELSKACVPTESGVGASLCHRTPSSVLSMNRIGTV